MKNKYNYASWIIAIIAMSGSLFFSNVLNFEPCTLCWWQRIFMYPLVFIFTIAFIVEDENHLIYSVPLILLGLITSSYHNLIYYKLIPQIITACDKGLSCTTKQIEWIGFVTIPLLSFFAFSLLFVISLKQILQRKKNEISK